MKQLTRKLQRLLGVGALALTLGLGACSEGAEVSLLGPQPGGPSESLSLVEDLQALLNGQAPEWLTVRTNSKVIGPEGGFVYLDLHYLYVPRGAVTGPTKFEVTLRDDFKLGASLTATSSDRSGNLTAGLNNVGAAGFQKPVYLTFSYQFASNKPSNPNTIKVVEIVGTELIAQPTSINWLFQTATGTLNHFSDYGLAWPGRGGGR